MEQLIQQLRGALSGSISTSESSRNAMRRDAGIFDITPESVATPKDSSDIKKIVKFVNQYKANYPTLSLTPRGAGTDMTGAAIGSSIILDMESFSRINDFKSRFVSASPGAKLYDIQHMLGAHSLSLGSAPSSQDVSTIGGMVANNAAGTSSFTHGNTQQWVRSLRVVLADGNEYTIRPLNKQELEKKMVQPTYEGRLYAHLYSLLNRHYDTIRNARPYTVRNASGYNLWDVWDREAGRFDMTQLFTGSQGTLGVITNVTIEAVKKSHHTATILVHVPSSRRLQEIIDTIASHKPLSLEAVSDLSLTQMTKAFRTLRRQIGTREYAKQQIQLLPSAVKRGSSASQLLIAAQISADSEALLTHKTEVLSSALKKFKVSLNISIDSGISSASPRGRLRASTASLLQEQIKLSYDTSLIGDIAVHPSRAAAFYRELKKLVKKNRVPAVIYSQLGDGVFQVIPIVKNSTPVEIEQHNAIMRQVIPLVLRYEGTLSAQNGDGMIRGPWLPAQFSHEVYAIFKEVKELFDPLYIFNPHKKTDASLEYNARHLRDKKTPRSL